MFFLVAPSTNSQRDDCREISRVENRRLRMIPFGSVNVIVGGEKAADHK